MARTRCRPRSSDGHPIGSDDLFDGSWDDEDFLLIEDFQDMPPDRARHVKENLDLPDEAIEPMYAVLERWNVSANVAANLVGLLADAKIQGVIQLLEASVHRLSGGGPRRGCPVSHGGRSWEARPRRGPRHGTLWRRQSKLITYDLGNLQPRPAARYGRWNAFLLVTGSRHP